MNPELAELQRLGRVDPPAPAVLDAAREVLWSAVAAEMLATDPAPPAPAKAAKAAEAADQHQEHQQKDAGA
jgi:hypothetical protein